MTVLLEYIKSFSANFHKHMNIAINVFHILSTILALCLMVSMIHYAQNYAGIIGGTPVSIQ